MRRLALAFVAIPAVVLSTTWASGAAPVPDARETTGPGTVSQEWTCVSENSAVIYWQTENPATSWVEYGPTPACGRKTATTGLPPREFFKGLFDRPYHTQFHRLTGLEPDRTYHYRMVSIGTDGTQTRSDDRTFSTRKIPGAVHVPDDVAGGPPYVLNKANATYVLTKDIEADGTAIRIDGHDITLDLNGHTVVYGNAGGEAYGVRTVEWNKRNIKVLNGVIRQGKGNGARCDPVRARSTRNMEVAGVEITYGGPDCMGIHWWEGRDANAHHNVLFDTGTHITNRHQGLDAIQGCETSSHNLVKRARHRGVNGGAECACNEICVDSWATNASCVGGGLHTHHNWIYGTGYIVIGVGYGWGDQLEPKEIHHNHIEMVAQKVTGRWQEYGDSANLSGLRVTMYHFRGENFNFHDNTILIHGSHATKMRGLWIDPTIRTRNVVFRNNVVEVIADETCKAENCMAVTIAGEPDPRQDPVVLEGNTLVSNICNVRFAESYGTSCNTHFLGNTFVRKGDRPDYRTVRCGWWVSDTYGHVFRDSKFEGGAGYDKVFFEGGLVKLEGRDAQSGYAKMKAARDITVEWTLTVKTAPGAKVTVKDAAGNEVFSGAAADDGKLDVPLAEYKQEGAGEHDKGGSKKTTYTPHTVTVAAGGRTASRQVTMDRKQEIVIRP